VKDENAVLLLTVSFLLFIIWRFLLCCYICNNCRITFGNAVTLFCDFFL